MNITGTIEYTEFSEHGETGFYFSECDSDLINMTEDSRLLCHDLLEHVNGLESIGTREDELQALGAVCFGRYQFEYLDITSDLKNEFEQFANGCELDEIEEQKETEFEDQLEHFLNSVDYSYLSEELKENNRTIEQFKKLALNYMRLGITKAQKIYKSEITLANLFFELQNKLDEMLKYLELYTEKLFIDIRILAENDYSIIILKEEL